MWITLTILGLVALLNVGILLSAWMKGDDDGQ